MYLKFFEKSWHIPEIHWKFWTNINWFKFNQSLIEQFMYHVKLKKRFRLNAELSEWPLVLEWIPTIPYNSQLQPNPASNLHTQNPKSQHLKITKNVSFWSPISMLISVTGKKRLCDFVWKRLRICMFAL